MARSALLVQIAGLEAGAVFLLLGESTISGTRTRGGLLMTRSVSGLRAPDDALRTVRGLSQEGGQIVLEFLETCTS